MSTPATERKDTAPEEEQVKILEQAKNNVKTQAFYMKRCLDANNLMDALKHASNMICELRTSLLGPKNYYALYIETFDQLRFLENYLLEGQHGKKMAELYELVQYAGNILPRLYLLVTVGSAYIKLKEAPAKDVLKDLVEMCRGVQHPTRGLFLRTYLMEVTKDKLPDNGNEFEGKGGAAKDSIDFVLVNFTEMNKLWVRMQHQGPVRERDRREQERGELRLLVGKNIARLSQLEGVDLETYSKAVLPRLVEQVVNCKDVIAQQYLMEVIIQAFPDDFHLRTLDVLLSTCGQLQGGVNIKNILVSLIDRLANFAGRGEQIPSDIKVFNTFSEQIANIVQAQPTMLVEDILALEASLLNLSITCYPGLLENVDEIFKFCNVVLEQRKEENSKQAVVKQITKLLQTPLDTFKNILTVLKLENYPKTLSFLSLENRRRISIDIARTAVDYGHAIPEADVINKLLELIAPIVRDPENPEETINIDEEDFIDEQNLVASLVHLCESSDLEQLFAMYLVARKHFGQGGPKRIKYTLVPLVFRILKLALRLKKSAEEDDSWEVKAKKVFKFAHETTTALARSNMPETSLRLYLQCAQTASVCGAAFETIAYEFVTQAFLIYEEQVADSQAQFNAITIIIGSLQLASVFSEENYDTLITKAALYASKLLKKPDQCRAICLVSHLFWCPDKDYKNGKRVLECLQKALKIAGSCMEAAIKVYLFVDILNQYLFYFENQCDAVTIEYLSGLIQLINTNITGTEANDPETGNTVKHYQNTLAYIRWKSQADPRYQGIDAKF
mmetsp:Transcript_13641/g.18886  ORF Transcript_13641/g.18886 Transcript_13641/m.18886 type:complete len:789 (+) Transcript_13641:99-2465(+)|eukprot:CAMPEP_0168556974 /NCGR_PEP_ID=MMETSP0413-20121227/9171_1 /TAXON_ID=136452 /ORGANISM="Filamoeba nolandi, Strain NC-AS-23-1" /LENGTH=788 /DNA_ID=CAMNT_0008587961 /DNA_START=40 /DNA_END=2406 /DNA_ORIENTATION=+